MSGKTFIDTNIMIYAHDIDARAKNDIAKAVLAGAMERTNGRS